MNVYTHRLLISQTDLNEVREEIEKIAKNKKYLQAKDLIDCGLFTSTGAMHSAHQANLVPERMKTKGKFVYYTVASVLKFIDKIENIRKEIALLTQKGMQPMARKNSFSEPQPKSDNCTHVADTNSTPKPEPTKDYRPVVMELNNKFSDLVRSYNMMVKESIVVTDKIEEIRKLFIEGI